MLNTDDLRCNVCSKVFDRRSRLESHYKIHTGERPYSCPYCNKSFVSRGNCNTHIRVHTKERPYQCPHCGKSFSQNGQLVIHARSHTGEKPFRCTYCSKAFACAKVLKTHIRTHTGEKPFSCEYCAKGFAAYANLVVHKRIHTKERPYVCKLCGRGFEHSGNLGRHVRVHNVENGVRCIPCGEVFVEAGNLMEHTQQIHPNESHKNEESDEVQESVESSQFGDNLGSSELKKHVPLEHESNNIDNSYINGYNQSSNPSGGFKKGTNTFTSPVIGNNSEHDSGMSPPVEEKNSESGTELFDSSSSERSIDHQETYHHPQYHIKDSTMTSDTVNPLTLRIRLPKKLNHANHRKSPVMNSVLVNVQNNLDYSEIDPQVSRPLPIQNNPLTNVSCNLVSPHVNSTIQFQSPESIVPYSQGNKSYSSRKRQSLQPLTTEEINTKNESNISPKYSKANKSVYFQGNQVNPEILENKYVPPEHQVQQQVTKETIQRYPLNLEREYDGPHPNQINYTNMETASIRNGRKAQLPPLIRIEERTSNFREERGFKDGNLESLAPQYPALPSSPSLAPISPNLANNQKMYTNKEPKEAKIQPHLPNPEGDLNEEPYCRQEDIERQMLLETIRENTNRTLTTIVPKMSEWDMFKAKVELALVILVGEKMKDFGYPKRTTEQVLIDILDIAGKSPCADVRVDEGERLKVNFCKFLEYFLPSHSWEDFGGKVHPIDTVLDSMVTFLTKTKALAALLRAKQPVNNSSREPFPTWIL